MAKSPAHTVPRADRPHRDWVPMAAAVCVWLCTLPLVFLLVAPRLGALGTVAAALALFPVIAAICWLLYAGRAVRPRV